MNKIQERIQARIDEFYKAQKTERKKKLCCNWKKMIFTNFRYGRS